MQVCFRIFRGAVQPWDVLFAEAAEFATSVGFERLIGISHSHESSIGVVTVWYWGKAEAK
jgi:hypothetical protein